MYKLMVLFVYVSYWSSSNLKQSFAKQSYSVYKVVYYLFMFSKLKIKQSPSPSIKIIQKKLTNLFMISSCQCVKLDKRSLLLFVSINKIIVHAIFVTSKKFGSNGYFDGSK